MKKIGQQGEVAIYNIPELPEGIQTKPAEKSKENNWIVSHSESGNNHVIPDGEVLERTDNVPAGMRILYLIAQNPTVIRQESAGKPHGEIPIDAGVTEFRISREYDPFADEIRQVAD